MNMKHATLVVSCLSTSALIAASRAYIFPQIRPLRHSLGWKPDRARHAHLGKESERSLRIDTSTAVEQEQVTSSHVNGGSLSKPTPYHGICCWTSGENQAEDEVYAPSAFVEHIHSDEGVGESVAKQDSSIQGTDQASSSKATERSIRRGDSKRAKNSGLSLGTLSKRLVDNLPLLSPEEMRTLLNPAAKDSPTDGARGDNLALLIKDVREVVEDLRDKVGGNDVEALADLKDVANKFKGVLRGDPKAIRELRRRVLHDLEEVRDEIEGLLEVEELTKARARLEKATKQSTEQVFDSAVDAMVKGLDAVIVGKDLAIKEGEETETLQVSTYFYGRENEFWDDMQANGVTPRRVFLYTSLAAAVGLGGNLFGVTSGLLGSVAPQAARDVRLDIVYPVGGFKRCYSPDDGYEFIYPKQWVADAGLALRQERDSEDARMSSAALLRARQRRNGGGIRPSAAFGPPGGDSVENISIVKSELMGGFSIQGTLGSPTEAAEKLLSTFIAPPDSGREWELLDAFGEDRSPGGLVYQFEYKIQGKGIRRPMHNVGVVAARGSTLFTVTVLAPQDSWTGARDPILREMARSFRLTR